MTAVSRWEREDIGERTRDAMHHKRGNGERVGTVHHVKKLPSEYVGERHVVTVGLPDGKYHWEERPGPAPANEDDGDARTILRIIPV
jgi:hypothetical protein